MNSIDGFFLVAIAILAAASVAPFSRHRGWWVRGLDFPRLQVLWGALLLLCLALMTPGLSPLAYWITVLGGALCSAVQAPRIIPFTPLARHEMPGSRKVDESHRISLLTSNVLMTNRNSDALLGLVERYRPNIIVVMETDQWWQGALASLEDSHPYTLACPQDNLYGMHVYSNLPLGDTAISFLVEPDVPSMHALVRLGCGTDVRVHFLHPAPPSPTENPTSGERDAELIVVAKSLEGCTEPVIVGGDLNDVGWSDTTQLFKRVSKLRDPRVGRGLYCTFHAQIPLVRWPLDHLFASHHFTVERILRLRMPGSDHFALLHDLALEPGAGRSTPDIEPQDDDAELVKQTIEDQPVDTADVPEPGNR